MTVRRRLRRRNRRKASPSKLTTGSHLDRGSTIRIRAHNYDKTDLITSARSYQMGSVADDWIRKLVQREPQHSDSLSFFQALQENLRAIAETDRVAIGGRFGVELS